jgi:hypothetical protein
MQDFKLTRIPILEIQLKGRGGRIVGLETYPELLGQ